MRSASKVTPYESLQELNQAGRQLALDEHPSHEKIRLMVESAFGCSGQRGLIPPRIDYYYRNSPLNWAEEVQLITKMFSPGENLLNTVISAPDYPVFIDPKLLPRCVLAQFPAKGDKQSTMMRGLRRQLGDKFLVSSWEWFWANVAQALISLPQVEEKRTTNQEQGQDQMYFLLSRNPLLVLIRRGLQYKYRKEGLLLERLRGLLQLYVVEELLSYTRSAQSRAESKYQVRPQHFGILFLLLDSRRKNLNGETLQVYQQYFLRATDHYSAISSQGRCQNVRYLIRLWCFLLTREEGADHELINKLELANPKDGWYRLARCPLERWLQSAKKAQFLTYQLPVISAIRANFYRLLKKQTEWTPSFSFLAVLQQFVELDRSLLQRYIKRPVQKEEDSTIALCFERTLMHLAQNGAECSRLQQSQNVLNDKFKDTFGRSLNVNFAQRSEESKRKLSKTSRQKMKSLSYQNPRIRDVWEHPLQENQFYILLVGSRWISEQIDKLIPGRSKRAYPCLNLRIFANPFIFLITLLVMMYGVRLLIL